MMRLRLRSVPEIMRPMTVPRSALTEIIRVKLGFGDKIVIKKAEQATNILKLSKLSFLEILSKKMQTCI